jgi:hypothetical protein
MNFGEISATHDTTRVSHAIPVSLMSFSNLSLPQRA